MLSCENLTVRYPGASAPALADASLRAEPGETVGILGPNGSGKSTLLAALSGLLAAESGETVLDGKAIRAYSHRERARRIAWVPQRAGTVPELSVRDVVLMGRYAHLNFLGGYTDADRDIAAASMEATDVLRLAERSMHSLSGGECQRVLAARAFAQCVPAPGTTPAASARRNGGGGSGDGDGRGGVLMLDEAGAGLDPAHALALFDAVTARVRKTNLLVLAAMHDLNMAALYCERLVFLKNGRILAQGTTTELFTEETLAALYDARFSVFAHPVLGLPQAVLLPGGNA